MKSNKSNASTAKPVSKQSKTIVTKLQKNIENYDNDDTVNAQKKTDDSYESDESDKSEDSYESDDYSDEASLVDTRAFKGTCPKSIVLPERRPRGCPPGSSSDSDHIKRPRGRPPKEVNTSDESGEKRKPGRPRKESETESSVDEYGRKRPPRRGRLPQIEKERMEANALKKQIEKIKREQLAEKEAARAVALSELHAEPLTKQTPTVAAPARKQVSKVVKKPAVATKPTPAKSSVGIADPDLEPYFKPTPTLDRKMTEIIDKTHNSVEMVTTQCNALKVMFEALRDFTWGFYLVCDKAGVHFEDYNSTKKFSIFGNLFAENFERYYCDTDYDDQTIKLGIRVDHICSILKPITNSKNTISLYTQAEDKTILNILIANSAKRQVTQNRVPLVDLDENTKIAQDTLQNYSCIFTYPANFFQQTIKHMNSNEFEYVEFKVYDGNLELTCISDSVKRGITAYITADTPYENEEHPDPEGGGAAPPPVDDCPLKFERGRGSSQIYQGIFSLKNIVNFAKCTSLCTFVRIYLENDSPLGIQYDVSGLGTITLCLDPHNIDEDIIT